MVIKNKFLIGTAILLVIAFYAWSKRTVDVEIADVSFRFPAQAVISSTGTEATGGLDRNPGAFVALPNGPYHGKWGLLLQSNKDRHGDGMPSGFKEMLSKGDLHFSKTPFGWLNCDANCGRDTWFFHRLPNKADSTYSVGTVICFDTDICKLFLSYRDVDVQVSLERQRVNEASMVMNQVVGLLRKYDLMSEHARKRN
jgi:hypothetical protein